MRDLLGFAFAFISALFGALLLYNGIEDSSSNQTLPIIGGAVLMTLALETLWFVIKARLEGRQRAPGRPSVSDRSTCR